MRLRAAFIGFRHAHIWDVYQRIRSHPDVQIVACCEEDQPTREAIERERGVVVTHADYRELLDSVDCDFVVVGDYFGKRGRIVIDSLTRGRHVLSDKPLCTRLEELQAIGELVRRGYRVLGMMLDLRCSGIFLGMRDVVRGGGIGEVQAVSFGGQHPLRFGTRPSWYHEEDKHGGTINDIAVHGFDAVSWITGLQFSSVVAARCWQANLPASSHFRNAAQCMLTMENQCGVIADVSYLSPDAIGYGLPLYWRMTFWGARGMIESSYTSAGIALYRSDSAAGVTVPAAEAQPASYLAAFLAQIAGRPIPGALTPEEVLRSSEVALRTQEAADRGLANVRL